MCQCARLPAGASAGPEWPHVQAADLLIDKERPATSGKRMRKKKSELLGGGEKREAVREKHRKRALAFESFLFLRPGREPWIVHLRIINHCLVNPLQVLSIWVNASTLFFLFFPGEF